MVSPCFTYWNAAVRNHTSPTSTPLDTCHCDAGDALGKLCYSLPTGKQTYNHRLPKELHMAEHILWWFILGVPVFSAISSHSNIHIDPIPSQPPILSDWRGDTHGTRRRILVHYHLDIPIPPGNPQQTATWRIAIISKIHLGFVNSYRFNTLPQDVVFICMCFLPKCERILWPVDKIHLQTVRNGISDNWSWTFMI